MVCISFTEAIQAEPDMYSDQVSGIGAPQPEKVEVGHERGGPSLLGSDIWDCSCFHLAYRAASIEISVRVRPAHDGRYDGDFQMYGDAG